MNECRSYTARTLSDSDSGLDVHECGRMIDAIVMPVLKCIFSLFLWAFLVGVIGFGVHEIHDEYELVDLEDWSLAISLAAIIGIFAIFVILLNLRL